MGQWKDKHPFWYARIPVTFQPGLAHNLVGVRDIDARHQDATTLDRSCAERDSYGVAHLITRNLYRFELTAVDSATR